MDKQVRCILRNGKKITVTELSEPVYRCVYANNNAEVWLTAKQIKDAAGAVKYADNKPYMLHVFMTGYVHDWSELHRRYDIVELQNV